MKSGLRRHFPDNETITIVKKWFISTGADFYGCSMQVLFFYRWQKCIANDKKKCVFSWTLTLFNDFVILYVFVLLSVEIGDITFGATLMK